MLVIIRDILLVSLKSLTEKVLDDAKIQRDSDECDVLTMKTLQWLQTVDAQFADKAAKLHDVSPTKVINHYSNLLVTMNILVLSCSTLCGCTVIL